MLRRTTKKGVSIMVGYVMLISIAVIMGVIAYNWMKTYIPNEEIECPDGVALRVQNFSYDCTSGSLNLTLRNNGKFNIAGYHIAGSTDSSRTIANIPLMNYLIDTGNVFKYQDRNAVLFIGGVGFQNNNSFSTGSESFNRYDVSSIGNLAFIQITPTRWETIENRLRFATCGEESRITEQVYCG